MPYVRDRTVFKQFEFAPVTGPTGVSTFESIGTRDIIVQKPKPEWLTLSATGLVSFAAALDEQKRGDSRPSPNPQSILARHAGSALHLMHECFLLFEETLPGSAPTTTIAWHQFQRNLDVRLEKLLPTTPPHEVLEIRRILEDRSIVFPRANQHHELVEAGYRYLAQKILNQSAHQPPLVATEPLALDDEKENELSADPEVLDILWQTKTAPSLRAKANHLIQWHEETPQTLGRALSRPTEGTINGLPELSTVVVASGLRFTLFTKTDEARRWATPSGDVELNVIDLKSSSHVRIPPKDSFEEVAGQSATYLLAVAMAETAHPRQEKPGYPLTFYVDTDAENPRVLRAEDHVSMPIVALGQYPPEIVDRAKDNAALVDPYAAQALLVKTEDLLDRIRKEKRKRKSHG